MLVGIIGDGDGEAIQERKPVAERRKDGGGVYAKNNDAICEKDKKKGCVEK